MTSNMFSFVSPSDEDIVSKGDVVIIDKSLDVWPKVSKSGNYLLSIAGRVRVCKITNYGDFYGAVYSEDGEAFEHHLVDGDFSILGKVVQIIPKESKVVLMDIARARKSGGSFQMIVPKDCA